MIKKLTIAAFITVFTQSPVLADTVSVGKLKHQWNKNTAIELLKAPSKTLTKNVKTGQTRQHVLSLKNNVIDKSENLSTTNDQGVVTSNANTNKATNSLRYQSFNIYHGYSQLIEDFDDDGFFQTFSVTFDADVYNTVFSDHAVVYAELYLSKNGGDWIHYYTTDDFSIYGESDDDEYEVYTTLNQGYIPEYYDVLIDLYEVGYNDVVATYSSNDTNELYALPLESSDYDPDYVEYHSESHGHGGSSSMLILSLLLAIVLIKNLRKTS